MGKERLLGGNDFFEAIVLIWGAKIKEMPIYYYPKIVGMDIKPRESTQTYQLIRTINRHLPKFAYNIMSNFYYRHAS